METGFVYSNNFNQYNFGEGHPLTPLRIELTYSLMKAYNLLSHPQINILTPKPAKEEDVLRVHQKDYVDKLKELNKLERPSYMALPEFGLGPGDNPIFPGMYDAALAVSGASITAADYIMQEGNSRAFNIVGGLHHSMPGMASGFCIFNDIAISIKFLQNKYPNIRIMYLDIDAHHGDGVQWIFYDDPNVLTLSFHQDGRTIFPGTGHVEETGKESGKGYSLNFPVLPGTIDSIYLDAFKKIVPQVMDAYQPDLLLLQSGVDTHFSDPITNMGLSTEGQEKIFKIVQENTPKYCNDKLLAVGGGGYNIGVVARTWTMYLAQMLEQEISEPLPEQWVKHLLEKWDDSTEEPPTLLRDRNVWIEEKQLKDPYWQDDLEFHCDKLVDKFEKELIPQIKSHFN